MAKAGKKQSSQRVAQLPQEPKQDRPIPGQKRTTLQHGSRSTVPTAKTPKELVGLGAPGYNGVNLKFLRTQQPQAETIRGAEEPEEVAEDGDTTAQEEAPEKAPPKVSLDPALADQLAALMSGEDTKSETPDESDEKTEEKEEGFDPVLDERGAHPLTSPPKPVKEEGVVPPGDAANLRYSYTRPKKK